MEKPLEFTKNRSLVLDIFDFANFFCEIYKTAIVVVGALWYRLNMVGPIEKIPMQANLYSHTGSSIKISGWSGVRFSVRFPVLYS